MSENSLNQPYYLRYRELGWLDRRLPEMPDFFSDKLIRQICRESGAGDETDQEGCAKELREIAQAYWVAAMSSPLKIGNGPALQSPDERIRKLNSTVLNPAKKLIDALVDHNLPLLSEWPDKLPSQSPDREHLLKELNLLIGRVRDLTEVLDDRKRKGSPLSHEFKIDLANALTDVFERHIPSVVAARGGYDRTKDPSSEYRRFMTECGSEIFGSDFSFSGNVLDEVALSRGNL